jgi:L-iditol 2-dehydrogenase
MLEAVLTEYEKFVLRDVPKPRARKGEAVLAVRSVGICGSDFLSYLGKNPNKPPERLPLVLGHEVAGEVMEAGAGVTSLKAGDRVVLDHIVPCGQCLYCRQGAPHLCPNITQLEGGYAEYLRVPAGTLLPFPESISYDEAALIQPLAIGFDLTRRVEFSPTFRVLILGAGTIGLMALQAARVRRAAEVTNTDLLDTKLEMAKRLGADRVINVTRPEASDQLTELASRGIDVVIDCVCTPLTLDQAISTCRNHGKIVVTGLAFGNREPSINLRSVIYKQLHIIGATSNAREDMVQAIEAVQDRKVRLDLMISRAFPLRQIDQAFKLIKEQPGGTIKVILHP